MESKENNAQCYTCQFKGHRRQRIWHTELHLTVQRTHIDRAPLLWRSGHPNSFQGDPDFLYFQNCVQMNVSLILDFVFFPLPNFPFLSLFFFFILLFFFFFFLVAEGKKETRKSPRWWLTFFFLTVQWRMIWGENSWGSQFISSKQKSPIKHCLIN